MLRDLQCRRSRELVGLAANEIVKIEFRDEIRAFCRRCAHGNGPGSCYTAGSVRRLIGRYCRTRNRVGVDYGCRGQCQGNLDRIY
jgi:hypothetical protein